MNEIEVLRAWLMTTDYTPEQIDKILELYQK